MQNYLQFTGRNHCNRNRGKKTWNRRQKYLQLEAKIPAIAGKTLAINSKKNPQSQAKIPEIENEKPQSQMKITEFAGKKIRNCRQKNRPIEVKNTRHCK